MLLLLHCLDSCVLAPAAPTAAAKVLGLAAPQSTSSARGSCRMGNVC